MKWWKYKIELAVTERKLVEVTVTEDDVRDVKAEDALHAAYTLAQRAALGDHVLNAKYMSHDLQSSGEYEAN
jgi:hypothetical protein